MRHVGVAQCHLALDGSIGGLKHHVKASNLRDPDGTPGHAPQSAPESSMTIVMDFFSVC
jgi:hypothetical protein